MPVWYWPVLWYNLARLAATLELCCEEGRRFLAWRVERNGVIWVEYWDESEAERRARGALPAGFDRTPWARRSGDTLTALFDALGAGPGRDTVLIRSRSPDDTILIPSTHAAPAPHPP